MIGIAAALLSAATATAQAPLVYCTPGATQACVAAALTTSPAAGGTTEVTLRVANLQGVTVAGTTPVAAAQLHAIDVIGPATFVGGAPGPLTVTTQAPAVAVADVENRWGVYEVAEDGEYRGYALFTDIEQNGADLVGCTLPDDMRFPYYRTCGAAGDPGALVFQFATPSAWSAGQLGVTFVLRVAGIDRACEVPGTLWDAPDVPNCVTPGVTPPPAQAQTVAFTSTVPSPAYVGASYAVSATATSGLAVALSSLTPTSCTVAGTTVTFAAAGPCIVAADQAGDAIYLAAPQATQAITVVKRPQEITFSPAPPASAPLGGSHTLGATGGGSGNPVVLTSVTPGTCTVTAGVVHFAAVGPCTVAADQAGNATYLDATQETVTIAVVWPFGGFAAPVAAAPVLNLARAGGAVPVKFGLGGDRGLGILAAGSPASVAVACTEGDGTGTAELAAVTAGSSTLAYDAATGLYTYVWKTEKGWAGTCRRLTLRLTDGTTHAALFSFR